MLSRSPTMNCETARLLMENNDPALAQHLLSCPSCVVRTRAQYYEPPPDLEGKIRQSLRRENSTPAPWRLLAIAASILLAASVAWNIALLRYRAIAPHLLAANVL